MSEIGEEACCGSVAVFVAVLLRVRPQFRSQFAELLRVLRVKGGKGEMKSKVRSLKSKVGKFPVRLMRVKGMGRGS